MVDAPCPEVEASCNHDASLRADQVQSRAAVIVSVVEVASATRADGSALIEASQRTPPGAVMSVTELDPHAPRVTTAAMQRSIGRLAERHPYG